MSFYKRILLLFLLFLKISCIGFNDFQSIGSSFLENKKEWALEVGVEFSFDDFFKDFEFEKAYVAIAIGAIALKFGIDYFKRGKVEVGHSKYPLCAVYESEGFGSNLSPIEIESLKKKDFQKKLALYMKENAEELKPYLENLFAAFEISKIANPVSLFYSILKDFISDKENLEAFKEKQIGKIFAKEKFKKLLLNKFKFTEKIVSDFCEENKDKSFKEKCKNFFLKIIGKKPKQILKKEALEEIIKIDEVVLDKLSDTLSDFVLQDNNFTENPQQEYSLTEKLESDKKFLTEILENKSELNSNLSNVKLPEVNSGVTFEKKELELPPRLENFAVCLFEIAKDSLSKTLKTSIENPKSLILNSAFGEFIFAYDVSKVGYNIAKIGITSLSDFQKGKSQFFEYTQPFSDIFNFFASSNIDLKDKAKILTSFFFDIKTRNFLESSIRKGLVFSLNSVSNKISNSTIEFDGIYFNENNNKFHSKNYNAPGFHPTDTPYVFKDSIENIVNLNSKKDIINHVFRDRHSSLFPLVEFLIGKKITSFSYISEVDKEIIFKKFFEEILKVADGKFPTGRVFTKIELEVHGFKIMVHGSTINGTLKISTIY